MHRLETAEGIKQAEGQEYKRLIQEAVARGMPMQRFMLQRRVERHREWHEEKRQDWHHRIDVKAEDKPSQITGNKQHNRRPLNAAYPPEIIFHLKAQPQNPFDSKTLSRFMNIFYRKNVMRCQLT